LDQHINKAHDSVRAAERLVVKAPALSAMDKLRKIEDLISDRAILSDGLFDEVLKQASES
jgi:hypothetical protein